LKEELLPQVLVGVTDYKYVEFNKWMLVNALDGEVVESLWWRE